MKTLFVFNHPAPYKVHVFNELAKLTSFDVIFERDKAKDRPESFYSKNEYNFSYKVLKHCYFSNENTFSGELKQYIKKHHQEYDLIVMNGYSTIAEMKAIRYMIKNRIPYVLQINGGVIKKDSSLKKKIKTYYISHAAKYFSPCEDANNYLTYYGADKNNIFHYPYGNYFEKEVIETPLTKEQKEVIRKKWSLPEGTIFVNASQFIERKNNIQLISLFRERQETLLLIGSGKERQKYESIIKEGNIKNVIIMDFLDRDNLFEVLKACDYFITLSEEDIFGHTTLEAMANGLPVISSNRVVSSRDIIENGKNGYLVDIENNDEIINAINSIKADLAKNAIETAKRNTIEKSAKRLYELVEGK